MHTFNFPTRMVARFVNRATWLAILGTFGFQGMQPLHAQKLLLQTAPSPVTQPVEKIDPAEQVAEIRILGNDTISTERIASQLSTRVGRPFDRSVVTRDVYKLANLGWFVDVKPLYETTPQGRIVFFQVSERPTIRYVTYLGNKNISAKKLAKQTNLEVGGSIDPYAVEEGRRKIREHYQSSGYNNVQITILEGTKPTDQGVVYLINEGQSQKIWKVQFVGNEFVPGRRLKSLIQSKPPLMMLFNGYVDLDQINSDVDQLTAYYRSFGFFQARVGRKLDFNEQGNWADLTFVIDEGPRYAVRNIQFLGNTKFEPEALAATAKLTSGESFEQSRMQQDTQWLQELYGSHGYVFADVKPETVFLEEPGEVDLVYHIQEGSQWRVGRILVQIGGDDPHTRIQTALNRITLRSGDIMDIRKLKASERRLLASSLFHSDPASGARPTITYRIPEDSQIGLARSPVMGIRGQSPDARVSTPVPMPSGLPVLLPPIRETGVVVNLVDRPHPAVHCQPDESGKRMDVVFQCTDREHFLRWQQGIETDKEVDTDGNTVTERPIESSELQDQRPDQGQVIPNQEYRQSETIVRGQSPAPTGQTQAWWAPPPNPIVSPGTPGQPVDSTATYSRTVYAAQSSAAPGSSNSSNGGPEPMVNGPASAQLPNNVYAQVPVSGVTSPYGGQIVQPTGPNSTVPSNGYAVQYNEPLQPPPGVPITPTTGGVPPGAVTPGVGTAGYQLFPGGHFGAPGEPYPGQAVDVLVGLQETQTGRLMIGAGVNSNAGIVGNIVLDERNFDWRRWPRSFEDFRNGSAWRGDGQRIRIDASPGSIVNRYLVSFQEPYLFDSPISLGLSGSLFDRRYTDYDEQRVGGRVSLGYQWVEHDLSATIAYRGENVEISDIADPAVPELSGALGNNTLHGCRLAVVNDTRDNAFLPTQGHFAEVGVEQVIGSYDYTRGTLDFRQYFLMRERPDHSGRHVLSLSTRLGFTGSQTPVYDNFFAGGYSTLRGFDFRGASPVDPTNPRVVVGGEFQWLNSVQYLFPLTADEMLHGVVFSDFGTVERKVEIKDFRVALGAGLRITVPAMGPAPIALDFTWAANQAEFDETQVFSFSLGYTR
ncbi:MAG: BamA/TamA family outer membrane protein [Pirellulales bacterium]